MNSNSDISLVNSLTEQVTLFGPIIVITIGTIGCLCNFVTFTSVKLRKNSCSFYFLGAAVFDLLTLDFGALTRLLADHFGFILYHQSQIYCKLRQYLVNILPALATLYIVLAALDRYMSTSDKLSYRSLATMPNAKRIASISSIICVLSYIHYPIFADLRPTCSLMTGTYGLFAVVYSITWTSVLPHFLMICFGIGMHRHIRTARRRVTPASHPLRRFQRKELQLITMMLIQVGVSSVLILTRIGYFSYSVITNGVPKTDYQKALDVFFSQFTTQLFYLNYAKSFYLYTLASNYFRRIFTERVMAFYRRVIPGRRVDTRLNSNRPIHPGSQAINVLRSSEQP